ncbi:MAG: hypothetical protein ACK50P_16475 [Planctomycetaceae bacterium]
MILRLLSSFVAAFLLLFSLAADQVWAYTRNCQRCGCGSCSKVCRLVCEDKKVTVTCWGVQEEDFCVPGRGVEQCQHCEEVCECQDAEGEVSSRPRMFSWKEWQPCGDPEIRTKRKLMRKTVTKKVPTYKWVIQDLCEECRRGVESGSDQRSAPEKEKPSNSAKESGGRSNASKSEPSGEPKGKSSVGGGRARGETP